jgi:hypothetical protein
VTIDRNLIHDTGDFSLACDDPNRHTHGLYLIGQNYKVTNNIIYNTVLRGIQTRGQVYDSTKMPNTFFSGFQNSLIANNTIAYGKCYDAIVVWDEGGGNLNNSIVNNIFFENSQQAVSAQEHGISFTGTAKNITIANNISYASPPGKTGFLYNQGACSGCTITNNSVNGANPNMANAPPTLPTSPDFHLTNSSTTAIGFGLNLMSAGVTTDYSGKSRPASGSWDVSAYQFNVNATNISPPRNLQVR